MIVRDTRERPTLRFLTMPGSSSNRMVTSSSAWGSCATNLMRRYCDTAMGTRLKAASTSIPSPEVGVYIVVVSIHSWSKGVSTPSGSVTKDGGDWSLMRQQCCFEA